MVLEIIKPVQKPEQPSLDGIDLGATIASGMNLGEITNLHSCVEYVNTQIEPDVGGSAVEGTFKKVLKEAKDMSSQADRLAREGKTIPEMENEISGEHFGFTTIKNMKIEVYGSVDNWLAKMTADEV